MKKSILLSITLAVALCYQGCYEDKGHYDYTPVNKISVVDFPSSLNASLGDTLYFTPAIAFSEPADAGDFEFWWEYRGEIYSGLDHYEKACDGLELRFVPRIVGSEGVQLCAREIRTGVITTFSMSINSGSTYSRGWLILREEENETKLSYIRPDRSVEGDVTSERVYTPYVDIHGRLFPGESLGNGPRALRQLLGSSSSVGSAFYILQQNESVCLNGLSYKKEIFLSQEFLGGAPAGLDPRDYYQGLFSSVILNADGTIYYRDVNGFFIDAFANFPMKRQGEVIRVDRIIPSVADKARFFALFDKDNKRFLWVYAGDHTTGGTILPAPSFTLPGEYLDYNDTGTAEILYTAFYNEASVNAESYNITLYRRDGNVHVQRCRGTYDARAGLSEAYLLSDFENNPFPTPGYLSPDTKYYQLETRTYLFFATGNNLYWYDHLAKTTRLFYTFPAGNEVVKMDTNPQESELGVALTSGKFVTLNIENDRLMSTDNKIYEINLPGTIVDMEYKFPNSLSYIARTNLVNWD
jgi:hypothetical protein